MGNKYVSSALDAYFLHLLTVKTFDRKQPKIKIPFTYCQPFPYGCSLSERPLGRRLSVPFDTLVTGQRNRLHFPQRFHLQREHWC